MNSMGKEVFTGSLSLSAVQQRLWFLNHLVTDDSYQHIALVVAFKGKIDEHCLQQSIDILVARHAILRTTFLEHESGPVQILNPSMHIALTSFHIDDRQLSQQPKKEWQEVLIDLIHQPFNLSRGPFLRLSLAHRRENESILLLVAHRILFDEPSMNILLRELAKCYTDFKAGGSSLVLSTSPFSYADFIGWQKEYISSAEGEKQLHYWLKQLDNVHGMIALPSDHPRSVIQEFRGSREYFELSDKLLGQLAHLAQNEGMTLSMLLLTAFYVLLFRYTQQSELLIGVPTDMRSCHAADRSIGNFMNIVAVRINIAPQTSFHELASQVRDVLLDAYHHQEFPFEILLESLQLERELSHAPLFQVSFQYEQHSILEGRFNDVPYELFPFDAGTTAMELALKCEKGPDGLKGFLEYNINLFDQSTIKRMTQHLQIIIENIVDNYRSKVQYFPLLTTIERHLLVEEWSRSSYTTNMPSECLHRLFEVQAEKTPDAIAVEFEDQKLTYHQLNERSNQLAHYLQTLGIGPEVSVVLSVERSLEMILGLLGILKAGGACIPLDPEYPQERLAFMLNDVQAPIILTQQNLKKELLLQGTCIVFLDAIDEKISRASKENPCSDVRAENICYVIYTSGSTGQPKGVMVAHQGVSRLLMPDLELFGLGVGSTVLQYATFSFDAFIWDVVLGLLTGARLYLARKTDLLPGPSLVRILREQSITSVLISPSVLDALPSKELLEPSILLVGGEVCSAEHVERWAPGRQFYNAYGPTETTVAATWMRCRDGNQKPLIGRPLIDTEVYILDNQLNPVPIGVTGEIYVGGRGVARGYLHHPELTANSFIPHPFSRIPGARLYKTGDLARYCPNGNIDILGRADHQVKIRGFRIELDEIEVALRQHEAIQSGVVIAKEDSQGMKRLVAYVVLQKEAQLTNSALHSYMRSHLPEYMLPSMYVFLDVLPLNPTGKVDRRTLPEPDQQRPLLDKAYTAPRNEVEKAVANIWSEVLNLDEMGIYDGFFELGGHSLLVMRMLSQVEEVFHLPVPLGTFFLSPTIADLALNIIEVQQRQLNRSQSFSTTADIPNAVQLLENIDTLSEAEIDVLLNKIRDVTT